MPEQVVPIVDKSQLFTARKQLVADKQFDLHAVGSSQRSRVEQYIAEQCRAHGCCGDTCWWFQAKHQTTEAWSNELVPFDYGDQLQLSRGRASLAHGGFYEVEFSPSWQLGEFIHIESELAFSHDNSALIWWQDNDIGEFELDELSLEVNVITRIKQKHEFRWKLSATSIKASARTAYTALADGQLQALGQGDNFLKLISPRNCAIATRWAGCLSSSWSMLAEVSSKQTASELPIGTI